MSHRSRLISLLVLFALLIVPVVALAQDGEDEEMQQYTSPDGFLTVSYPADWLAQEDDFPYGAVIADSQETLDYYNDVESEDAVPSGSVIVVVTLATLETFQMFGMAMEEGMTPEEMLPVFLDFISGLPEGGPDGEPAMDATAEAEMDAAEEPAMDATAEAGMEAVVAGEVEVMEFEDGRQVAYAPVEYVSSSSDIYMIYELGEGVYVVFNLFTAPGELTDELLDTGFQIAESVAFTGTPDVLMMQGPDLEESDVDPSTLDGNALIDERCTVCHDRQRIDAQDKDEAGWTETVDRMISYGADLDSAERQAVIDYLVETH